MQCNILLRRYNCLFIYTQHLPVQKNIYPLTNCIHILCFLLSVNFKSEGAAYVENRRRSIWDTFVIEHPGLFFLPHYEIWDNNIYGSLSHNKSPSMWLFQCSYALFLMLLHRFTQVVHICITINSFRKKKKKSRNEKNFSW